MCAKRRKRQSNRFVGILVAILLSPLKLVEWIYHITLGRLLDSFARRSRRAGGGIGAFFGALGDTLIYPFVASFNGLWFFFSEWFATRNARTLLAGVPAVLIGFGTVGAIAYARISSDDKLIQSYERLAIDSMKNEDFESAQIFYEKLSLLKPQHDHFRYAAAIAMFEEGDEARALNIMNTLAPTDGSAGFPPARNWVATRLLQQTPLTPEVRVAAKQQLRMATSEDPENTLIHLKLAELLLQDGGYAEAFAIFDRFAAESPLIQLNYASLLRRIDLNKRISEEEKQRIEAELDFDFEDESIAQAQGAENAFRSLVSDDPIRADYWYYLHQTLAHQYKFQDAFNVLERARLETAHKKIDDWKAALYVLQCTKMIRDGETATRIEEIIGNLEKALGLRPNYEPALELLIRINDSEEFASETSEQLLREKLVDSQAPAMIHFLLGTKSAGKGDFDQALYHFNLARSLRPELAVVLNNTAWVMASQVIEGESEEAKNERLAQALSLADSAVENAAANNDRLLLSYYDTRGQIHVLMGHFDEAFQDLQRAQPLMASYSPRFHEAIAACYRQQDQDDLAAAHEERAKQLRIAREQQQAAE